MAAKKGSADKLAEAFDGLGEEVKSNGFLFPGADPHIGLGVVGKVAGYRQVKSGKGDGDYTVADLAEAVVFEPGSAREDGASRLVKVPNCGVIVSGWIRTTLTAARFPAGSVIKVVYDGVNKEKRNAKMLRVFTASADALAKVTERAEEDADGTYSGKSGESDDLPF